MRFYSIRPKFLVFNLKIQTKLALEIRDMSPKKTLKNKNDKYSQDYLQIQDSIILALYLYLERKKCYNFKLI